jgi:protein translocase SecG subunit
MVGTILTFLIVIVLLLALGLILVTLSLNTKSEGLGAAITGASDSYRGAVGVEEQKRNLLRTLCFSFMATCFVYGILLPWN